MTDPLLEVCVELEEIGRQVAALKAKVRSELARQDQLVQNILDAIRDNDEAATGGPVPCCDVHPGFECATHAFAALQRSSGICTDGDEPPSRTP